MYRWTRWFVTLSAIGLLCSAAAAQTRSFSKQLNAGIHAFQQARYFDAITHLDAATGLKPNDPRAYFFRGLAKDRIGQLDQAEADYQIGAQMEVVYSKQEVGRYLHRIQGSERARLERFRKDARALSEETLAQLREQQAAAEAARIASLQSTNETQQEEAPNPVDHTSLASLAADSTDPFAETNEGVLLGRGEISPAEQLVVTDGLDAVSGDGAVDSEFDAGDFVANEEDFAGDDTDAASGDDFAGDFSDDFATDGAGDDFGDFGGDDSTSPDAPTAGDNGKQGGGGILGAALRAFGRSVTPDIEIPVPGPGGAGPAGFGPGGPGGPAPEAPGAGDDFGGDDFDGDFDSGDDFGDDFGDDLGTEETDGNPFDDDPL